MDESESRTAYWRAYCADMRSATAIADDELLYAAVRELGNPSWHEIVCWNARNAGPPATRLRAACDRLVASGHLLRSISQAPGRGRKPSHYRVAESQEREKPPESPES